MLYRCLLTNRRRFDQSFGPYQDYKGNILHKCLYDKNEKTDISINNLRCSSSLLGLKIYKNGWFKKESHSLTTLTPNSLLTHSYYYIPSSFKRY